MEPKKPGRPPKPLAERAHVKRLMDRLRGGQSLHLTNFILPDGKPERRYFLDPSRRRVLLRDAEDTIAAGLLVPCQPGLFIDTPQAWGVDNG